jgi:hypothetical protein
VDGGPSWVKNRVDSPVSWEGREEGRIWQKFVLFSDSDNCEWKCRRILQAANVLLYGAFQVPIKSFLFGHF